MTQKMTSDEKEKHRLLLLERYDKQELLNQIDFLDEQIFQTKETLQWVKEGEDALKAKIKQLREVTEMANLALRSIDASTSLQQARDRAQKALLNFQTTTP